MKTKQVIIIGIAVVGAVVLFGVHTAYAADPQFMTSWHAYTSVPTGYEGKAFPVQNSSVDVAFELISQDKGSKGKIIDISNKKVRWYINGKIVSRVIGSHHLKINNQMISGDKINVRIAVEYYDTSQDRTYFPETSITIPVKSPRVAMTTSSVNDTVSVNGDITVHALPFFFPQPTSLSVDWSVDGNAVDPDNHGLDLPIHVGANAPESGGMQVSALVSDTGDSTQDAIGSTIIYVQ